MVKKDPKELSNQELVAELQCIMTPCTVGFAIPKKDGHQEELERQEQLKAELLARLKRGSSAEEQLQILCKQPHRPLSTGTLLENISVRTIFPGKGSR